MKLDLPTTGDEQPPLFVDAPQCLEWCKALPLSSPIQAQAQLLGNLLVRAPLRQPREDLLLPGREPGHRRRGGRRLRHQPDAGSLRSLRHGGG